MDERSIFLSNYGTEDDPLFSPYGVAQVIDGFLVPMKYHELCPKIDEEMCALSFDEALHLLAKFHSPYAPEFYRRYHNEKN
jgi:hypothetical protein